MIGYLLEKTIKFVKVTLNQTVRAGKKLERLNFCNKFQQLKSNTT